MVQFQNILAPAGQYFTVPASSTTKALGQVGAVGDWLDTIIIIPATTTPGAVTVFDGATAVLSIPAGTATVLPYVNTIPIRAYSKSGAWNVTTGASVSAVAIGQFT